MTGGFRLNFWEPAVEPSPTVESKARLPQITGGIRLPTSVDLVLQSVAAGWDGRGARVRLRGWGRRRATGCSAKGEPGKPAARGKALSCDAASFQ